MFNCQFMRYQFGPDFPDITYVPHDYPEERVDLGEVVMNYAATGSLTAPALVLIPGQTESWWGYEQAMKILEADFRVFAIDLRGQGRTTRTPGRYTLDNMANDVVRFIQTVVGRACFVSGLSSGGVISAWLSAFAPRGLVRAAVYEDPPLYASQVSPAWGPSIRQTIGPIFALYAKHLGPQWSVGDWDGFAAAIAGNNTNLAGAVRAAPSGPPQNFKEYDPEWAQAFCYGLRVFELRSRRDVEAGEGSRSLHAPHPADQRTHWPTVGRALGYPGRSREAFGRGSRPTLRLSILPRHGTQHAWARPGAVRADREDVD